MFKINEESLSKQFLFKCAIIAPLVLFFVTGFFAWHDKSLDLSSRGFNYFLEISKFPLGILSLSIPFVAIVAHIHRTIQTAKQIDLTNEKNTTDRFYAHHKYITESLSNISSEKFLVREDEITLTISSPFLLYRDIYPHASPTNGIDISKQSSLFSILINKLESIDELLIKSETISNYESSVTLPSEKLAINIIELFMGIDELTRMLHISKDVTSLPERFQCLIKYNDKKIKAVMTINEENQLKDYIGAVYNIANKIFDIFQVDGIPPLISLSHYIHKGKKYHFASVIPRFIPAEQQPLQLSIGEYAFSDDEYDSYRQKIEGLLQLNV